MPNRRCLAGTCVLCLLTISRLMIIFAPRQAVVFLPAQTTDMGSAVRLSLLGLLLCTQLGRAPARSLRTADQVSEADIQRLLHGVMEQLGIARPRVEYPAHQATNIVGPQSIQGGRKCCGYENEMSCHILLSKDPIFELKIKNLPYLAHCPFNSQLKTVSI